MREEDALQELGLSPAESRVYLALLETGPTLAGPIIKKTGLHRATAYQVLQRLKEKGLASSIIKGKKQHFQAADPQILMGLLKEREEIISKIMPLLKARMDAAKEKQDVTVFYGKKGVRAAMERMLEELNPRGEYCDFGVSGLFREVMGPYWDLWQKKKRMYSIKSYVIFNEELIKKNPKLLEDYYGEARFHPREYTSITDTMIYNDTVLLLIWTAKPPVAVRITNRDNAESYRNQFWMMWESSEKA